MNDDLAIMDLKDIREYLIECHYNVEAIDYAIKVLENKNNIRWTDKVSLRCDGDIIDFNGRLIGHINIEDMRGDKTNSV